MDGKVPKLSIVCPAFNEEEALPRFHHALVGVVDGMQSICDAEIIYVDDGSRDGTLLLLRQWAQLDPRVRYLSFSRNFGNQAATTAGLEHARGEAVVTMDADLQHPPEVIPHLVARWQEGYEVVVTIRTEDRSLGWFKRYSSEWFLAFLRRMADTKMQPSVCDFRLLSRKATDGLLRMRESHRFLRGMVPWLGFPTAEVPFQVAERAGGASKFNFRRLFILGCDALVSSSKLPLRLPLVLGLAVMLVGVVLALAAGASWWLGRSYPDLASLLPIISLNLLGGGILCCLGVVGEYVGRIFDQVRERPLYLLKETEEELAAGMVRFPQGIAAGQPGEAA